MSYIAIAATTNSVNPRAYHSADPQTAAAAAISNSAAVTDDITAALAVPAISGDSDATAAVTLIQTDFQTVLDDLGAAPGAAVVLSYDPAAVTTKNQLRACVAAILRAVDGAGDLT